MTVRFRHSLAAFILGVAVATLGIVTPSHAAVNGSQAITISPASTDVKIDPGASVTKSIDIINSGNDKFNVSLSASPYHVTGENYDPSFTQLPGTVDASAWVHLDTTEASVGSDKVLTLPYTITVPKGTAPGGYYAVLFAVTSKDNAQTGVVSQNRVGNILYITVNGTIKAGGKLTGDSLPVVSLSSNLKIGMKVSNSGGTHFITNAHYTVTDLSGNKVFTSNTERYILPQTEREFSSTWTPKTFFGIYTIHRDATIAGKLETLADQKVVIMNPWFIVAVAFLIGILIGVPMQRARQRRRAQRK